MSIPPEMIRVNFGALTDGSGAIRSFLGEMSSHLTGLENDLESKMADWDGSTREAYWAQKAIWNGAANRIETRLVSIAGSVDDSCEQMSITEQMCSGWYRM